ncbi:hypothetical protein N0O92_06055 [Alkalihalobacillus sp. MEB130]|uniref:hypothetical protein n=1 Tax=Alkalihalobacillus sp. MEB130 TaxID=2976704 RepID=UPI0028DFA0CB|nr:hypothetical protein [Alkalihalobacillus sp. MEB130]MDT8859790.1 hypothetical protein [Alkalihalobacillus sp. MEB130]
MIQNRKDFASVLEKLDDQYHGLFHWLAGQYDPATGGFYYAKSSINDHYFSPDIESTAQALNMLIRNNLIDDMPNQMRTQMVHFFQSKQKEDSGFFYDDYPMMAKDEVMVHRAINYSINSLKRLGGNALYPLPLEAKSAPDYVKSPEEYLKKWRSIDLSNSWRGCDLLATSCVYLEEMPKEKRVPFLEVAEQYLASIQHPQTGLWGEGSLYVRISGTFKLHTFYSKFKIPMPNPDRIYQSILTCLKTEEAVDMCYIRNPIDLLSYMNLSIPAHELLEILEITATNINKLKREDGGFSREIEHSPPAPNVAQVKKGEYYPNMPEPVCLGKGLYEGDMNASTQATLIRLKCYSLAGITAKPIKGYQEFYRLL